MTKDQIFHFFSRLLGLAPRPPSRTLRPKLPDSDLAEFREWFDAQTKPAIALIPDAGRPVVATGSRLGGPAWLAKGEPWPTDTKGEPMEFLAQLDMADCRLLDGYPCTGIVQFFIARDDTYGLHHGEFKDGGLFRSEYAVRHVHPHESGQLVPQPELAVTAEDRYGDFTVFEDRDTRRNGIALRPERFTDRMAVNIHEAEERLLPWYRDYDVAALWDHVEAEENRRRESHHTGGYPAYTQVDIRGYDAYRGYDQVLLRLTSDGHLMWGDVGEAVFLMRPDDLADGDFSRVLYSWDCT